MSTNALFSVITLLSVARIYVSATCNLTELEDALAVQPMTVFLGPVLSDYGVGDVAVYKCKGELPSGGYLRTECTSDGWADFHRNCLDTSPATMGMGTLAGILCFCFTLILVVTIAGLAFKYGNSQVLIVEPHRKRSSMTSTRSRSVAKMESETRVEKLEPAKEEREEEEEAELVQKSDVMHPEVEQMQTEVVAISADDSEKMEMTEVSM